VTVPSEPQTAETLAAQAKRPHYHTYTDAVVGRLCHCADIALSAAERRAEQAEKARDWLLEGFRLLRDEAESLDARAYAEQILSRPLAVSVGGTGEGPAVGREEHKENT
jgi:hypothetical protein